MKELKQAIEAGATGEMLPGAPITRNQVELMQVDTVVSPRLPSFADLGISPRAMKEVLESILRGA